MSYPPETLEAYKRERLSLEMNGSSSSASVLSFSRLVALAGSVSWAYACKANDSRTNTRARSVFILVPASLLLLLTLGHGEILQKGQQGPVGGHEGNKLRFAARVAVVEENLYRPAAGFDQP